MRFVFIFLTFLFMFCVSVNALQINEVMYNPPSELGGTYAEWIELYNDGSGEVNLTGWKISDNRDISGDDLIIPASGYFVIAKTAFFDNFSYYYSTTANAKAGFSLNNGGEQILLINTSGDTIDSVTYSSDWGAAGNNYSLQANSTGWCEGAPTPGASNECVVVSSGSEENQTSEDNQTSTPADFCSNATIIDILEITEYPDKIKFGESNKFEVEFNATCYGFNSVKFLVYGSSSRVISYKNGTKIKKYSDCQEGKLFDSLENKTYEWSIPFFTYPNCDDKYEEDENYSISFKVCSPSWDGYHEDDFEMFFSGGNSSACTADKLLDEETEDVEETVNEDTEPVIKTTKSSSNNTLVDSKRETIYESDSKRNLKIGVGLLSVLFIVLLIYMILNKGKV